MYFQYLPDGPAVKTVSFPCGRHEFNPLLRKFHMPHRRKKNSSGLVFKCFKRCDKRLDLVLWEDLEGAGGEGGGRGDRDGEDM